MHNTFEIFIFAPGVGLGGWGRFSENMQILFTEFRYLIETWWGYVATQDLLYVERDLLCDPWVMPQGWGKEVRVGAENTFLHLFSILCCFD